MAERNSEVRTTAGVVAGALRRSIIEGSLDGGDRLRQDALATEFGVSQMIVREAFNQLIVEGFIQREPRRGVSVSPILIEEVAELSQIRALLEAQVLEWAFPHIDSAILSKAETIVAELDECETAADYTRLNNAFHGALYEPAGRRRSIDLVEMLHLSFERYFHFVYNRTGQIETSQEQHRDILKAVRDGDRELACKTLRLHIMSTGEVMTEHLRIAEMEGDLRPVSSSSLR